MKLIDTVKDEITRTIDDLRANTPGLQVSVLISVPVGENDVEATFISTHSTRQAAAMIAKVLQQIEADGEATPDLARVPEAS